MSYADHAKNIQAAIAELKATRGQETMLMMLDEVAVVKSRVINKGENAEGGGFNPYSPQYKKLREKKTLPTSYRNFSFTAEMWKNVEPVVIEEDDVSTTYVIGSEQSRAKELIGYNKKQSGDFLALSKSEQELLHSLNQQRVFKVLSKHGVI